MTDNQDAPEPDAIDLAAIEDEWPLIAAELDLVSAECRLTLAPTDVLAIRAHRRAVRAVLVSLAQQAAPLALVPATPILLLASGTVPDAA